MGKVAGKKLGIDEAKNTLNEKEESKFKICVRCNSPFPAHLGGRVCSCVVGWLAEAQFKFKQTNREEEDKDVKSAEFLDSHTISEEVRRYLFREKD